MSKSTICLAEALPIPGRAFSLRTSFNNSLLSSFKYLLNACIEVIPHAIFLKASQKLDSLNTEEKISGFLSALHADFFGALENEDIEKINEITAKLAEESFQVSSIKYTNFLDLNNYYSELFKNISSQEIIDKIIFSPLSFEQYEDIKKATQDGFKVIKRSFPDFFQESQELISEVCILSAEGVKQGSSADLFGIIYKSSQHKWNKLTDILEFIIHEQSHLYVHLLNKDDAIVLNPSDMYESPLRKEKRPLMGIYHATFVLARISHVLNKALDLNEIPVIEKEYCKELIDYYQKRCRIGLEILNKHAQMTPLGSALILSASKLLP